MSGYPQIEKFERLLAQAAPYMANTVEKGRSTFGERWQVQYEETLDRLFHGDDVRLAAAARGYVRFALDALRLQKRFEKDGAYLPKSYAEAARAVYHNQDYMETLYLPGILMSHYLWPHHYRQLGYFQKEFLPRVLAAGSRRFLDVGVGTGFYSRQALAASPEMSGTAYDISDHSLSYARRHVDAFGFSARWKGEICDVVATPPSERWPCVVSVEVLEHLEDPLGYLRAVRTRLDPGGRGFITAAITAPNEDHIYLYRDSEEVAVQLRAAGFSILDYQEDRAYEPRGSEPVPRLTAFIVS